MIIKIVLLVAFMAASSAKPQFFQEEQNVQVLREPLRLPRRAEMDQLRTLLKSFSGEQLMQLLAAVKSEQEMAATTTTTKKPVVTTTTRRPVPTTTTTQKPKINAAKQPVEEAQNVKDLRQLFKLLGTTDVKQIQTVLKGYSGEQIQQLLDMYKGDGPTQAPAFSKFVKSEKEAEELRQIFQLLSTTNVEQIQTVLKGYSADQIRELLKTFKTNPTTPTTAAPPKAPNAARNFGQNNRNFQPAQNSQNFNRFPTTRPFQPRPTIAASFNRVTPTTTTTTTTVRPVQPVAPVQNVANEKLSLFPSENNDAQAIQPASTDAASNAAPVQQTVQNSPISGQNTPNFQQNQNQPQIQNTPNFQQNQNQPQIQNNPNFQQNQIQPKFQNNQPITAGNADQGAPATKFSPVQHITPNASEDDQPTDNDGSSFVLPVLSKFGSSRNAVRSIQAAPASRNTFQLRPQLPTVNYSNRQYLPNPTSAGPFGDQLRLRPKNPHGSFNNGQYVPNFPTARPFSQLSKSPVTNSFVRVPQNTETDDFSDRQYLPKPSAGFVGRAQSTSTTTESTNEADTNTSEEVPSNSGNVSAVDQKLITEENEATSTTPSSNAGQLQAKFQTASQIRPKLSNSPTPAPVQQKVSFFPNAAPVQQKSSFFPNAAPIQQKLSFSPTAGPTTTAKPILTTEANNVQEIPKIAIAAGAPVIDQISAALDAYSDEQLRQLLNLVNARQAVKASPKPTIVEKVALEVPSIGNARQLPQQLQTSTSAIPKTTTTTTTQQQSTTTTEIPQVVEEQANSENATSSVYSWKFETSDGSVQEQSSFVKNPQEKNPAKRITGVTGTYTYLDSRSGTPITVNYVADDTGYHPTIVRGPQL